MSQTNNSSPTRQRETYSYTQLQLNFLTQLQSILHIDEELRTEKVLHHHPHLLNLNSKPTLNAKLSLSFVIVTFPRITSESLRVRSVRVAGTGTATNCPSSPSSSSSSSPDLYLSSVQRPSPVSVMAEFVQLRKEKWIDCLKALQQLHIMSDKEYG